jgi:hypothetical protein
MKLFNFFLVSLLLISIGACKKEDATNTAPTSPALLDTLVGSYNGVLTTRIKDTGIGFFALDTFAQDTIRIIVTKSGSGILMKSAPEDSLGYELFANGHTAQGTETGFLIPRAKVPIAVGELFLQGNQKYTLGSKKVDGVHTAAGSLSFQVSGTFGFPPATNTYPVTAVFEGRR